MSFRNFKGPYSVEERYAKKVVYFSMEFAVHQPLKIYSGGLGFLAGSHLRSSYELKQDMISIGILWKYGYYDQARNQDQTLQVGWMEKQNNFLEDTGIVFQVNILSDGHAVLSDLGRPPSLIENGISAARAERAFHGSRQL